MLYQVPVLSQTKIQPIVIVQKQEPAKPKPVEYIVANGDTLESIALAHGETAQRLFDKNTEIVNPDVIEVGQKILIPLKDEVLVKRDILIPPNTRVLETTSVTTGFSNNSGNLYTPGYCTFYAKQQRPDIPNSLGNANTWYSRAESLGMSVGYEPRVGAVAVAKNYTHVAIVTSVNGDSIEVSEMNYSGLWVISTRVAPASEFRYIY